MTVRTHYLSLAQAILEATGRKVHLSTALRWCIDGRAGYRLESWIVGGRRLTTVEAVEAFIAKTTAADSIARTPTRREHVQSNVEAQLAKELA